DDEPNLWIKAQIDPLFARDAKTAAKGVPLPGSFPVSTGDLLVFRGYDGVYGVATKDRLGVRGHPVRARTVLWRSKTTAGLHQLVDNGLTDDIDMKRDVQNWWNTYANSRMNVSSILYENPLIGSLAHDGQNVYFVDDVAVPPPPVYSNPDFG